MKKSKIPPKIILVVEDQADLRGALRDLLESIGLEVVEAANGVEGLDVIEKCRVNVVLTDIKMPEMDGIQFAEALRVREPDIPVIFLSGYADKDSSIKALRLGAFDMIEKPVRKDEVVQVVMRALKKSAALVSSKLMDLNLNSTQTKVLELVLKGMSNKEIADAIRLSEQGVKYHVGNLFKRFEATNRFELKSKILSMVNPRSA